MNTKNNHQTALPPISSSDVKTVAQETTKKSAKNRLKPKPAEEAGENTQLELVVYDVDLPPSDGPADSQQPETVTPPSPRESIQAPPNDGKSPEPQATPVTKPTAKRGKAPILSHPVQAEINECIRHGPIAPIDRALYLVFLESGLRVSEVSCLTIGMFFGADGKISRILHIPKEFCKGTCKLDRDMPLSRELRAALMRVFKLAMEQGTFDVKNFLFPGRFGPTKPWSPSTSATHLKKVFVTALGTAEGLRTHSTRRTMATELLAKSGNNITVPQKALGHAHAATTYNYIDTPESAVHTAKQKRRVDQRNFEKAYKPKRIWLKGPAHRCGQGKLDINTSGAPTEKDLCLAPADAKTAKLEGEVAALKARLALKQKGKIARFNMGLPLAKKKKKSQSKEPGWSPANTTGD